MTRASLPLYHFDKTRGARAGLWDALVTELASEGIDNLGASLDFDAPTVPDRIGEDVIFSQVCGFPLQKLLRGQALLLGAPVYDFEYCEGPTHVGVFVVRQDAPYRKLADLRGTRFVYSGTHSNSGMNLPRAALASLAGGTPFFANVEALTQRGCLERVLQNGADATCVDNVTLGYFEHCFPAQATELRVLALTPRSPSIPYITSSATNAATVAALRRSLQRVAKDEKWAGVRAQLFLRDIVPIEQNAYATLPDLERMATEQGYPELC